MSSQRIPKISKLISLMVQAFKNGRLILKVICHSFRSLKASALNVTSNTQPCMYALDRPQILSLLTQCPRGLPNTPFMVCGIPTSYKIVNRSRRQVWDGHGPSNGSWGLTWRLLEVVWSYLRMRRVHKRPRLRFSDTWLPYGRIGTHLRPSLDTPFYIRGSIKVDELYLLYPCCTDCLGFWDSWFCDL